MADNFAGEAYNIPYGGISSGEAMKYTADRQQQDQQQKLLQEQKAAQEQQGLQEKNYLKNVNSILDITNDSPFALGERSFDEYTHNALNDIRNKALTEYSKLDPAEMQMRIRNDMKEFIQWHTAAKNTLANTKEGIAQFGKKYKNVNLPVATRKVYENVANDFLEKDPNTGQWKRKPTDELVERNYVADLETPQVLGSLVNDETPFMKHIQGIDIDQISESNIKNNQGYKKGLKWTAHKNAYETVTPNEKGLPQVDVMNIPIEGVKNADGTPFKIIHPQVKQSILSDPNAAASFYSLWAKEKKKQEAALGREMTPAEEEKRADKFMYEQAKFFSPQGVSVATTTTIPKPTNTGTGSSSKNGGDNPKFRRLYDEIITQLDSPDSVAIRVRGKEIGRTVNQLSPDAQKYLQDITGLAPTNLFLAQKDGEWWVVDKRKTLTGDPNTTTGEIPSDSYLVKLTPTDIDIKANQPLGTKAKGASYEYNEQRRKASTSKPIKVTKTKDNPLGLNIP